MAAFTISVSQVVSKIEELQNANVSFGQLRETLQQTESRLSGMWEGQARDSFHNAFLSDINQLTNFQNLVTKYVQTLNEIAQKYVDVETRNTQIASERSY